MFIPYNNMLYPMFYPPLPNVNMKPPTLYALMQSMVNYQNENPEKIRDMYKLARVKIFNFEYPLTNNISKEQFEKMILNHFMFRRIGFETIENFRIHLDIKLNEIMPIYNKMFDSFENWDILNDGEIVTRVGEDNGETTSENQITNTSDRRNSQLPQSEIQNVKDASYLTDYNFDTDNNNASGTGTSNRNYNETTTRTQHDKMMLYKEMQNNIKSIYSMIFDDLDCLFYQLV